MVHHDAAAAWGKRRAPAAAATQMPLLIIRGNTHHEPCVGRGRSKPITPPSPPLCACSVTHLLYASVHRTSRARASASFSLIQQKAERMSCLLAERSDSHAPSAAHQREYDASVRNTSSSDSAKEVSWKGTSVNVGTWRRGSGAGGVGWGGRLQQGWS